MYVCMYVCMYVFAVVIPYYILFQKYMKPSVNANWCSHIITPSNATFTVSSSFNMNSGGEDTAEEERQSKLDVKEKQRV